MDYDAVMQGKIVQKPNPENIHCFLINITKAMIRWNGDVAPCCGCMEPYAHIMGNVFETGSYKAIWDSDPYRTFRKQAVVDCRSLKPCDQCHMVN